MIEGLKEIPGYSRQYVSMDGRVFSARTGVLKEKAMRLHNGYYRVNLRDDSFPVKTVAIPVHKLVLETFVGKRPSGYLCRHLNGNPLDNRLKNLCWGTPSENVRDAIRHKTAACLRYGEDALAAKLKFKDIKKIFSLYKNGHSQKEIADAFSISEHHVGDILNGKTRQKELFAGGEGGYQSLWDD